MLKHLAVIVILGVAVGGCTTSRTEHVGGPYYSKAVTPSFSWEPTYSTIHLLYRQGSHSVHITDRTGAFNDSIHRDFHYRVYGRNLAYVEFDRERVSLFRLSVYSERHRKVLVDPEFSSYWKVIADDTGIICHRYQQGQERDDPAPMVYSADYLKSL